MKDIRQSTKYGQYMAKIGWQIAEYKQSFSTNQVFIKRLPLGFSIIKVQRSNKINFDQLDQLAKFHHAILVSAEPASEKLIPQLLQHGFRMNKGAMIPSKTRQIDLSPSEQTIFQTFNRTRKYKISKAKRSNFEIKIEVGNEKWEVGNRNEKFEFLKSKNPTSESSFTLPTSHFQINDFVDLWSQNAIKRGFWVPIKSQIKAMYETFGENAYLLGAYSLSDLGHLGNLLAGILLIIDGKTAHYFYAASSPAGRNLCAPSLLTWEAMKLAKSKGCTIFDFEGIYDERFPQKSWQGFSYFKESFGGYEVSYPGRFVKKYGPLAFLPF